jgi:carbamoyltransferase
MIIFGINACSHDASISVIKNGEVLFAAHSERYSKIKNDWFLNREIVDAALSYGRPDVIGYYEKPFLKKIRVGIFGGNSSPYSKVKEYFPKLKIVNFKHHYSHACAGYYTSSFDDAAIVVLDAIGEFETTSIWVGNGYEINQIYSRGYPFSFGLFYSAFTEYIGLKPNEEEYIMMGMAAYGDPSIYFDEVEKLFPSMNKQGEFFHYGVGDFGVEPTEQNKFHIAAAVQAVYEKRLIEFMNFAKKKTGKKNLVFMGGCALNCSANTKLLDIYENVWIMPNPGDAGSSLGAAAAVYGKHLNWHGPYLGKEVGGEYPVESIFGELVKKKIAAVVNGRAEYGPRALGNRSIFADPRHASCKEIVNKVKGREMFRPFAPVVMEEHVSEWFEIDRPSPYMQYAVKCRKPEIIPSVVHADGTSRVQTVNKEQHAGMYELLLRWKEHSGVPVLLNTSLNIKGQPLLNDLADVREWNSIHRDTQICI